MHAYMHTCTRIWTSPSTRYSKCVLYGWHLTSHFPPGLPREVNAHVSRQTSYSPIVYVHMDPWARVWVCLCLDASTWVVPGPCLKKYSSIYTHIYTHIYIYIYVYIYIHTYIYIYVCMYVCIHIYIHTKWMASSRSYLNFNQVLSCVLARVRATLRDPNVSSPEDLTRLLKIRP